MTWVVDTCVILDILDRHPVFAEMWDNPVTMSM